MLSERGMESLIGYCNLQWNERRRIVGSIDYWRSELRSMCLWCVGREDVGLSDSGTSTAATINRSACDAIDGKTGLGWMENIGEGCDV